MTQSPLTVALQDVALAHQVACWLADEGIPHCVKPPGEVPDPGGADGVWLTDVPTLREAAPASPDEPPVDTGPRPALIVLGQATSWSDRILAAEHGASHFIGLPPTRDAVLAAARDLGAAHDRYPMDVLLFGPVDAATIRAVQAVAAAGHAVQVESDPGWLFERLHRLRPDVLALMPGVRDASVSVALRLVRSDRTWDTMMVVCAVPDALATADGPAGADALFEPDTPDTLTRALSELARGRWPSSLALRHPLLALRDQERRALDAHALVSITDSGGNIVYANDHFCTTSGYCRDELLGRNHRIVKSGAHPPEVYADLWRTIAGGGIWQGELCNRRKDGRLYWVATTIMPVGGPEAETRRYLSLRTDITVAKQVQYTLRRRVRQQRALAAVHRRLMACDRAQLVRLAPDILRLGGRLLGADRVLWTPAAVEPPARPVVAEWVASRTTGPAPPAGSAPHLVTSAGPEPSVAGHVSWWREPGRLDWQADELAFAQGLARALGSAWRLTAAELSQRASQLALTDMLRAFPGIAAAASEDMVFQFANEAFARLFGLRPEQVVGRSHEDLVSPDQRPELQRRRARIVGETRPLTFEQTLAVPGEDGLRHFSVVHFTTGGSGGIARRYFQIGVDVTERKRMDERLQNLIERTQAETRLQRLIANVATELGNVSSDTLDGLLQAMLREVGDFFDVDRAVLCLLSAGGETFSNTHEWCAPGVASNRSLLQGFHFDAAPWYRSQIVVERQAVQVPDVDRLPEEAAVDQALLRRLGLKSVLSVPILADGRVVGFIGFDAVRQRTDWSETAIHGLGILGQVVANALHRVSTEQTLVALKEQAEAANAAKSDFLASMSHELRTPMNAVLGFGQLLELALDRQPRERAFVQEILKGGRHLLTLIDDVLDLARIESGHMEVSLEPIALAEVVADCLRLMQPLADQRHIRIAVFDGSHVLLADRVRLKQVLVNLLSNAIKYNVDGGTIEVAVLSGVPGHVRVEVRDSGPGIVAERQRELFQPFNRLGAETGPIEGTGIGLVLVRRLVGLMDGQVGVRSALGQGSTFWFELPESPLDAGDPSAGILDVAFDSPLAVGDKRVLYVDDNPPNLRLMESILARWPGVRLLTAQHPHLGLELAEAHRPDIVLLDIQMAPLDGYQVLQRLRRHPDLAHVPVVAITANAMPRDIERARAAGFDECLTKPFRLRALLAVLERYLRPPAGADNRKELPP